MNPQKLQNSIQSLEQANKLRNDIWRLWAYSEKNNILVLCGYREPFEVSAFLIFRGTTYVNLTQWLLHATFEIDNSKENNDIVNRKAFDKPLHRIIITTKVHEYCIVCDEIIFFTLPKGAYV